MYLVLSMRTQRNYQEEYRYIEFDYKTKMFDEIDEKTIVEKLEREFSL